MSSVTYEYGNAFGFRKAMGPYNFTETYEGNNFAYAVSSDFKSGSKNPGWRRQVRNAVNATGAYQRLVTQDGMTYGQLSCTFRRRDPFWPGPARYDNYREVNGGAVANNPRIVPPSPPSSGSVDINARIDFIQRIRASRRSFQGGVFLGELREAIHMVTRPGQSLFSAVGRYASSAKKAARRANGAKAATRAIAGSYLEAVYGWRPLLSDIDSGMKALAKVPTLVVEVSTGRAKNDWYTFPSTYVNSFSGSTMDYHQTWRAKNSVSVRYKGAVGWESQNLAPSWQERWGLALSDFVPTVYELIPYSFLVDYFSNLGQIVDCASFGTVSLRWGCCSTVVQAWIEIQDEVVHNGNSPQDLDWRKGACSVHSPKLGTYGFTRQPIGGVSVGIGDLQLRCPGLDSTKWLNIGALAAMRRV